MVSAAGGDVGGDVGGGVGGTVGDVGGAAGGGARGAGAVVVTTASGSRYVHLWFGVGVGHIMVGLGLA